MPPDALDDLCALAGIERIYFDQFGTQHEVSGDVICAMTEALGLGGDAEAAALNRMRAAVPLEPATVVHAGDGPAILVTLAAGAEDSLLHWTIAEEQGQTHKGSIRFGDLELADAVEAVGQRWERRQLRMPASLPLGYHKASIKLDDAAATAATALLIVAPSHAFMPAALQDGAGVWGFAIQLYALRSERDWGIGDFGSLATLIEYAAASGAGVIGLNPLHALYLDEPERASPYSPSSRVYLNPLYIDVTSVPDYAESHEASALVRSPDFQAMLARLRERDLIDYQGVAAAKLRVLEILHKSFKRLHVARDTPRAHDFAQFRRAEGEPLRRFAIFQAVREERGSRDSSQRYWRDWPRSLRDPSSPAVAAFASEHAERIEFFEYLHWIAVQQLAACSAAARRAGMPIGLYTDLAVGVDAGAGEAWARQETIVAGWSVGAPPDNWNSRGQDWGLSPVNPIALRREGFRMFIDLVRSNMRCAGALRIDHILGLWRTFWIRHGTDAGQGAYLRYPFADLVGILALESHRARCLVIGEDLGTVPEGLQAELDRAGILSCRVMLFERHSHGRFRTPGEYPRRALVSVSTHDLPTLPAYWRGGDLDLRAKLGFLSKPGQLEGERSRRRADVAQLAAALRQQGLIGEAVPEEAPVEAVYRYLARTPGRLMMVQLEDALGVTEQINVPGTVDEYPNWRRRLPLALKAIFANERVKTLCQALARERPHADRA